MPSGRASRRFLHQPHRSLATKPYRPMLAHIKPVAPRLAVGLRPGRRKLPSVLRPEQLEAILNASAAWDGDLRRWKGNLRNRFLKELLAGSGAQLRSPAPVVDKAIRCADHPGDGRGRGRSRLDRGRTVRTAATTRVKLTTTDGSPLQPSLPGCCGGGASRYHGGPLDVIDRTPLGCCHSGQPITSQQRHISLSTSSRIEVIALTVDA